MHFNTKKKKKHHYKCELCFDDLADTQQFYNTHNSQEYTFVKLKRSQRENGRLLCWQAGLVHFNHLCSIWLLNMSLIFDCFQIKLHQQPRLLLSSATCPSFVLLLDYFWKVRISTRFVLRYFFISPSIQAHYFFSYPVFRAISPFCIFQSNWSLYSVCTTFKFNSHMLYFIIANINKNTEDIYLGSHLIYPSSLTSNKICLCRDWTASKANR